MEGTHIFNYTCYNYQSQPHCWNWVQQICKGACTGTPPVCAPDYDCSYCGDPGSICQQTSQTWTEIWEFMAMASNSEAPGAAQPSWTPVSGWPKCIGGTNRPTPLCNTYCVQDGHQCNCNPPVTPPPPTPSQKCPVPTPVCCQAPWNNPPPPNCGQGTVVSGWDGTNWICTNITCSGTGQVFQGLDANGQPVCVPSGSVSLNQ
jgi:hypothetical protein